MFISRGLYIKIDGIDIGYYLYKNIFRKIERCGQKGGCQTKLFVAI